MAHEALLREWALLRAWLDAARDDLRTERRLTATAREWDETGRDASFLAAGSRLDALERWADRWAGSSGWTPAPLEQAYLDASLQARQQAERDEQDRRDRERLLELRSVRRLRIAAAVLAAAVVGVSALTVYGFSQRDRAERESLVAQARALAAASAASLVDDPERSVLLALEAVQLSRQEDGGVLPEAEEALHSAVTASRVLLTLPGVGGAVDWGAQGQLVTEGPEESGLVEVRDGRTGVVTLSVPGHEIDVNDVAFSPDGRQLLTTGDDGAARLWDPATGRKLWERVATGQVWAPTFSGDGSRMAASWSEEGVVRVFDVAGGGLVGELRAAAEPKATALTHDGARIVVPGATESGTGVYDVRTGQQVGLVAPDGPVPFEVQVSPDGQWLATAADDSTVRLWSVADGRPRGTLSTSSPVPGVDWSPDSSRVVISGEDGVVRVFEVTDEGTWEDVRLSSTVLRGVFGVAFSPDGDRVLLGDLDAHAAQVFDVGAAGSREWLTAAVPESFVGGDFTDGGDVVASSGLRGGVEFRDVQSGRTELVTGRERGPVAEVVVSPDGALVAGAAQDAVVVWRTDSGAELFSVAVEQLPWELSWSQDGRLLSFSATDFRMHAVDRAGTPVAAPPHEDPDDNGIIASGLSPDGRMVVTGHRQLRRSVTGTGHVEVFDRSRGRVIARWDVDVDRLAVSPDGRLAAVAAAGGDVFVHDLDTGARELALVGHVGAVADLHFSADSQRLATAGQDATARVWDTRTGRQLVLRGHRSVVWTARLSPDGRRLVSTSGDGTVRVWAIDLDDLVQIAEDRLTRTLTDDECRRYLQRACT